jgi:cytochrome c oxidase cbb3-type subunit 2/cytochrome c oxidase cbb3-type subunit I/II
MAYLVASLAGVAFFGMSVVLLGVWPGRALEHQVRTMSPEGRLGLTASEERGRLIYSREGCAYCHTQQIRYLPADMKRFGAPTLAWETGLDYPHLWGTRRIGPDLSRAGGTRSTDWHLAHLFDPRAIVPDSVMPAYRFLFDGSAGRPRQSARDLVAYIESLGRPREIAGPEGEARARAACDCPEDEMKQMAFQPPLNASPARPRRGGDFPLLPSNGDAVRGRELFATSCAGCHGPRGEGDGPAASSLRPQPANLAAHEYTTARLSDALWNGVAGTAMHAWRDHSLEDLAALAGAVRELSAMPQERAVPSNIVDLGRHVYAANCSQCHGEDGAGNGSAASELPVPPTNFRVQRPTLAESLRAVRNGIDGTRMASWTGRLTTAEVLAAASYVRTFYQPDSPPADGAQ